MELNYITLAGMNHELWVVRLDSEIRENGGEVGKFSVVT